MKSSRDGTCTIRNEGSAGQRDPRLEFGRRALPAVSIILPFLDAERTIDEQLSALRAQSYAGSYEVLASDNGSSDGSRRIVERHMASWPALRLVDSSQRRGISHARNCALAEAQGDITLGCDADDVVAADWVEKMVDALVQQDFDVVGGRFDEQSLNPPSVRAWFRDKPTTRLQMSYGLAPVATGANYGAWRTVAREIGGWDTAYTCGGEDIAFSWRAQELGYRVGCAPDAIVQRRRRGTLAALARQSYQQGRQVPPLMDAFSGSPLGMPKLRRGAARTAWWLIASAPRALVQSSARGGWVRVASTALGVLVGRIEGLRDTRRE